MSASSSAQGGAGPSAASSPHPSVENEATDKKSKFEKRFKTDITSDEDVLSRLTISFSTMKLTHVHIQKSR